MLTVRVTSNNAYYVECTDQKLRETHTVDSVLENSRRYSHSSTKG